MKNRTLWSCLCAGAMLCAAGCRTAGGGGSAPSDVDPLMGIYEGAFTRGGEKIPAEAKAIPRGNGAYEVVLRAPPESAGAPEVSLTLRSPELERVPIPVHVDCDGRTPGVRYAYYHGRWSALPEFSALTPVREGVMDAIRIEPRDRNDEFGFLYTGYLKIERAGRHVFFTASDDGSRLFIGDTLVVDNDGLHGVQVRSGAIELEPGMHPVTVQYFECDGGEALEVWYAPPAADVLPTVSGGGLDTAWTGVWRDDRFIVTAENPARGRFELRRVERTSPTLGRRPPPEAVVLLPPGPDGRPVMDAWTNPSWRPLPDGSMEVGKGDIHTRQAFGDAEIHLEFMLPYEPEKLGQSRGNSGVYVQSRYELQVLDSFGLGPAANQCGGIYNLAVPLADACLPPLTWQTYDIVFRAPRFAADGALVKPARFEQVRLNGVLIHENVELPRATQSSTGGDHVPAAPLMLQDHGSPVRYRHIWIRPLE
jgi:hypothetical protein